MAGLGMFPDARRGAIGLGVSSLPNPSRTGVLIVNLCETFGGIENLKRGSGTSGVETSIGHERYAYIHR